MATKYPIVLAHGIILKDVKFFKAFGGIEKILQTEGHTVYASKTDGVGKIETNALQLKADIEEVLKREGATKSHPSLFCVRPIRARRLRLSSMLFRKSFAVSSCFG